MPANHFVIVDARNKLGLTTGEIPCGSVVKLYGDDNLYYLSYLITEYRKRSSDMCVLTRFDTNDSIVVNNDVEVEEVYELMDKNIQVKQYKCS